MQRSREVAGSLYTWRLAVSLEHALSYLAKGWSIFPLQHRTKRPKVDWEKYQVERATPSLVQRWWTDDPSAGVAVALGRLSQLLRVDVDGCEAEVVLANMGGLGETAEFTTPAGGRGYLLRYMDGATTCRVWRGKGEHEELRVQSDGAYTVLPPSTHPDFDGVYTWVREEPLGPVPGWLRDFYVERALRQLTAELRPTLRQPEKAELVEALRHVPADDYDQWVQVGMALKTAGDDFLQLWVDWSRNSPKFVEGECERKWATFRLHGRVLTARSVVHWAEQFGYKSPNRHEPLTDLGFAKVLANTSLGRVLHSGRWDWLAWDGARWSMMDAEKMVMRIQMQSLECRFNAAVESFTKHLKSDREATDWESKRRVKGKTMALIRKHEDGNRMREVRKLASALPELTVDYNEFDVHPLLFNCRNGTLNLLTGEFCTHDPEDMLTQLCDVEYSPEAVCPLWEKFLCEVLPDVDVRAFLHKFLGSCLTGDVSSQIMPIMWGSGANGKSTLIETVIAVLGEDYAMKANRSFLMVKRNTEHPTSTARLYRKRFVACVETAEDGRLDETLVKELTGGDRIAARRMREDEWEFSPTHKIVYATNHRPEVRGTDDGIWRRIPLVPFTQRFSPGDPDLKDKLRRESVGILRWMVEGCQQWIRVGKTLDRPTAVKEATDEYRQDEDKIHQFIADRCVIGDGLRVRVERLMEAYTVWCALNRQRIQLNGNAFGRALSERGFPLEAKGSKYRTGLDLAKDERS